MPRDQLAVPPGAPDADAPRRHLGLADDTARRYDALLILGFGGPEGPEDVVPFLERVTAGRGIPRERLAVVGAHYDLFGGVSPINEQTRSLVEAVRQEVERRGLDLPVFWGNRNSAPFVREVVEDLAARGAERVVVFPTSTFSSYSGCRQYREDLAAARVGDTPVFDKLRTHGNHPGFVLPMGHRVRAALAGIPVDRQADARIVFTAHSIPKAMADTSDYEAQLADSCRLVLQAAGADQLHDLVWQSRSGPPQVPWLEPDVCDHLRQLASEGITDVVLVPIGFVSDHVEVLFDLDVEARQVAGEVGIHLVRARTVGADPSYVQMVVDLVEERMAQDPDRVALGNRGPSHDICAAGCCPNLRHPETPAAAQAD